jgi:DNA polymerase I-like protein with 3'-5' exonuclease and polymerase domains
MILKYPDLSESKIISFDIETFDPTLKEMGPGVYSNNGRILGVAIADEKGYSEYYDIGHKEIKQEMRHKNLAYLKETLALPNKKLGTNILYDLDWLENAYNIKVNGQLYDVQIAEPLLDEYKESYSLDSLAKEYLNKEKFKTEIELFCEEHKLKGDPRKHLYLMPYKLVKKYAVQDVLLPLQIFTLQWVKLKEQNLLDLFHMEMALFPLLLQMRKTGVRIDNKLLEETKETVLEDLEKAKKKLKNNYGYFNYNSSTQIAKVFKCLRIPLKALTEKGNPSFKSEVLKTYDEQIAKDILEIRHKEKLYSTFLVNSFTKHQVNGRIHCSFFPMKTDEYGTKAGRFSSANPNLQQIPSSKEDPISYLCRKIFIPEEDYYWGKIDYSQIEYRFIAHYARGPKAEEIRKEYNEDPSTDYHQLIMNWTGTNRKEAKGLNFGMAYFMGIETCSKKFGWPLEKAKELIENYHKTVPFMKYTRNNVVNIAKGRGYIRTILNRRARVGDKMRLLGKEYSLFNRLIQGSAADMLKKAMGDCYNAGIFEVLKPHLTVHDELDVSIPKSKEGLEAFTEMKNLMEKAIKLKVPVIADAEIGDNWADCSEEKYKELVRSMR